MATNALRRALSRANPTSRLSAAASRALDLIEGGLTHPICDRAAIGLLMLALTCIAAAVLS